MSFIKICPAYAKHVKFYTTSPTWFCKIDAKKENESKIVPLHSVRDGQVVSEAPEKILFDKVGEYRIRTFIHAEFMEFKSDWVHEPRAAFHNYDVNWEVFAPKKIGICTERVCVFVPGQKAEISLGAFSPNTIYHVLVTIEHVES